MKHFFFCLSLTFLFCFSNNKCSSQQIAKGNKETLVGEVNELLGKNNKWDFERMKIDINGSLQYIMCLSPECNPYVSWGFFIKNILPMKVGKFEEYTTIDFACKDSMECMVPAGYEKGGRYEPKKVFQFFIKDKKIGKEIVDKLNKLQEMEF